MSKVLNFIRHCFTVGMLYQWLAAGGILTLLSAGWIFWDAWPRTAGALVTIGAVVLLVGVGGLIFFPAPGSVFRQWVPLYYRHRFRRVSWRLGYLQIGATKERSAVIHGFACSLRVNRWPITPKRFFLERYSGRPIQMTIQAGAKRASAETLASIPPGAWQHCDARILLKDFAPDDGVLNHPTPDEFLKIVSEFTLVFEYEQRAFGMPFNRRFRRRYSRKELKRMVDLHAEAHWQPPPRRPQIAGSDTSPPTPEEKEDAKAWVLKNFGMYAEATVGKAPQYSRADIAKIVGAIDALYPAVLPVEAELRKAAGVAESVHALIHQRGPAAALEILDGMRSDVSNSLNTLNIEVEKNGLYQEACKIAHSSNMIAARDRFWRDYNELMEPIRIMPDNLKGEALTIYLADRTQRFSTSASLFLSMATQAKNALVSYREFYSQRPTTDG